MPTSSVRVSIQTVYILTIPGANTMFAGDAK